MIYEGNLSNGTLNVAAGADATLNGDGDSVNVTGAATFAAVGDDNTVVAQAGGSVLSATGDGNVLQDGVGNDTLSATGSNNTFAIASGAGPDVVHASSSDDSDTIALGGGIDYDQLWFAQSSNDLVVSVIGKSQSVTVADWYAATDNHVGTLTTNDGHEISDAGVQQMVEAMAGYEKPASGQTSLPPGLATALAPALAANWHQTG